MSAAGSSGAPPPPPVVSRKFRKVKPPLLTPVGAWPCCYLQAVSGSSGLDWSPTELDDRLVELVEANYDRVRPLLSIYVAHMLYICVAGPDPVLPELQRERGTALEAPRAVHLD